MTMPVIRSNPLIPSTSVSSHHGTQTHTVQTSQFHDSECKDADFDLSSTDSDHDDDDQLKNKGCRDRRVFSTDSNDNNSDDLKGTRLFSPKKENAHESNHFSTRVEPAQIDAKHAWDKKKWCMGEAADRVNKKELDVLLYVEASFAKEQDLEEGGLIDLVQEKKKKMREIEAQYDLHIAKQEHVVAQAAEAAQKCTDRVGKKKFEFKECLGQVDRASAEYEQKKLIAQRLQFAAMVV